VSFFFLKLWSFFLILFPFLSLTNLYMSPPAFPNHNRYLETQAAVAVPDEGLSSVTVRRCFQEC
jgi:hypothetical protein